MMSYSVAKVIIFSLPLPNNKEKSPHLSPPHPRLNATPRDRVDHAAAPAAAPSPVLSRVSATAPAPASGSAMPRPLCAPALSRVSATAPASGSTMPRLPPQPLFPPLPASAPPPPRQGRPCRGSCRGPFARFVPRHRPRPRVRVGYAAASAAAPVRARFVPRQRPRPRVRVDHAAAPAAAPSPVLSRVSAPAPASGSTMPRLLPRPLRPLCPVGGGFAALIPQACSRLGPSRQGFLSRLCLIFLTIFS